MLGTERQGGIAEPVGAGKLAIRRQYDKMKMMRVRMWCGWAEEEDGFVGSGRLPAGKTPLSIVKSPSKIAAAPIQ
jgi:hypothetical protein